MLADAGVRGGAEALPGLHPRLLQRRRGRPRPAGPPSRRSPTELKAELHASGGRAAGVSRRAYCTWVSAARVREPEPLVDRDRRGVVRLDVEHHLAEPAGRRGGAGRSASAACPRPPPCAARRDPDDVHLAERRVARRAPWSSGSRPARRRARRRRSRPGRTTARRSARRGPRGSSRPARGGAAKASALSARNASSSCPTRNGRTSTPSAGLGGRRAGRSAPAHHPQVADPVEAEAARRARPPRGGCRATRR